MLASSIAVGLSLAVSQVHSVPVTAVKRGLGGTGEATIQHFETTPVLISAGKCGLPAYNINAGFDMVVAIPLMDSLATACTSCIKIINLGGRPTAS